MNSTKETLTFQPMENLNKAFKQLKQSYQCLHILLYDKPPKDNLKTCVEPCYVLFVFPL